MSVAVPSAASRGCGCTFYCWVWVWLYLLLLVVGVAVPLLLDVGVAVPSAASRGCGCNFTAGCGCGCTFYCWLWVWLYPLLLVVGVAVSYGCGCILYYYCECGLIICWLYLFLCGKKVTWLPRVILSPHVKLTCQTSQLTISHFFLLPHLGWVGGVHVGLLILMFQCTYILQCSVTGSHGYLLYI